MQIKKRVLILSANVGAGHTRAAEAIDVVLKNQHPQIETLIVDAYRYANAIIGKVAADGYIQMVKRWPKLYGYLYEAGRKEARFLAFKNWIAQIVSQNFKPLIAEFNPSVIVCTHAFPCGIASVLKKETGIPIMGVVTDYVVHPYWIYKNIDTFTVATMEMKGTLETYGIEKEKVKITGIPIDPRFNLPESKEELCMRHNLDPSLPIVLLMGGGLGLGPMEKSLRAMRKVTHPIQVLIVAGTNRNLLRRLEAYVKRLNGAHSFNLTNHKNLFKNVQVYSYIDFVHELMKVSNLVVTKPGGLTSTEAVVSEVPLLLIKPLPGQEERNSNWLVQKRVAVLVNKEKNIPRVIDELLLNPQKIERMKQKARAIKRPNAAYQVVQEIVNMLQKEDEVFAST